ncbi:hypothetical protein [Pseudomonas defluvii]|uniref:hypothetical protein n=1 Tax=Pseudomonas defluvii TaxID=1876757 RepID=UPI003906265F
MPTDKQLSFTANMLINGHSLIALDEATDRPVIVPHPARPEGLQVSQALGALGGNDEDWEQDRNDGLIDFHVVSGVPPTEFYFRHSEGLYRLYVRSGKYLNHGVFMTAEGVPQACPIDGVDPCAWQLRHAHNNQAIDLSSLPTDFAMISLEEAATGASLSITLIGQGNGGYLTAGYAPSGTKLRLNILARDVDWLSAS